MVDKKVSIIIPTRNERDNISKLLSLIKPYGYEVVIADDSDDDTPIIAQKFGVKVVKGRRLGLAQAVLDGIDATDGDYIIVMDADGQHNPRLLPEVVKQLNVHDLVVMTKHTKESMAELNWWRKLQSNLGVWASKVLVPVPISDPMSGFFGIRRKCLEGIPRGEYFKDDGQELPIKMIGIEAIGFKIGLELFAKAKWVSHTEIPMSFVKREGGQSKGTAHSLHKHLTRLYKNSLNYITELPKGSEEYYAFYEGTDWQKKWKQSIAILLKEITEEIKPKRLLDCGCGSSPNINYMSGERVGIDINDKALEYMREHSDAKFEYGDILDISFRNESFDAVACIEVLEHLYPKDIDKALSEIARVLQPKGYAIIATPNYASFMWNVVEKAQQFMQKGAWTSDHHTQFNRQSLKELCRNHGLMEVGYDGMMNNMDMVVVCQKL